MVYHMRPENPIRKKKKWLSDSEQLKMIDLLKHRANPLVLSPTQALNMLSSTSWAHSGTPCWEVSSGVETYWEKFETGQTTELTHFLCFAVIHVLLNRVESIYTATFNMLSPRTRSAQRIQRFSAMIQHEPLWNLRTAQHVESFERNVICSAVFEIKWRYDPRTCSHEHEKFRWLNCLNSPEFFMFMRQLLKLSSKCEDHIFIWFQTPYCI